MLSTMQPWRRLASGLAIAIAMAAGLVTVSTPAVAAETITNGNFSSGGYAWNLDPRGGVETCCAAPTYGYPNAFAHPDGAGGFIASWQNIAGAPAATYTLSGRIRTSGGTQQAWIQADWGVFDGRYCSTPVTNTAVWQQFSCTFSVGSGAVVHVALAASNAPATAWGWIAFDDISLTTSGGGGPYDIAAYMMRTNGTNGPVYQLSTGETMQIQYEPSNGRYYQVKNTNWEEMGYTGTRVIRHRDTSPSANEWYGLYTGTTLGSEWAPRTMNVGQTFNRNPTVRFYYQSGCAPSRPVYTQPSTIKLEQRYASITIGGHNLLDVIWLRSYLGTARWEDYYYARDIGLVRFVAYDPYAAGQPQIFESHYTGSGGTQPSRRTICTP